MARSANGSSHYSLKVHLTSASSLVCAQPAGEHSPELKQVCILKFLHDLTGATHDKTLHRRAFMEEPSAEGRILASMQPSVPCASCVELRLHNKLGNSPPRAKCHAPATTGCLLTVPVP